jgi:hypothetical protein
VSNPPVMPRYGTPNLELLRRWVALAPEADGPFWAINLMRYRERAEYADGRPSTLSGREADDAYLPLGPLAAVGAVPLFAADVIAQPAGQPLFERVGIVRYPSRAKFLEMQTREDFRELHAHKDAGMDFTIVFSAHPREINGSHDGADYILRLRRFAPGAAAEAWQGSDSALVAGFDVEGVIIGDERTWDDARFDVVRDEQQLARMLDTAGTQEQIALLLGPPQPDKLAGSLAQQELAGR